MVIELWARGAGQRGDQIAKSIGYPTNDFAYLLAKARSQAAAGILQRRQKTFIRSVEQVPAVMRPDIFEIFQDFDVIVRVKDRVRVYPSIARSISPTNRSAAKVIFPLADDLVAMGAKKEAKDLANRLQTAWTGTPEAPKKAKGAGGQDLGNLAYLFARLGDPKAVRTSSRRWAKTASSG